MSYKRKMGYGLAFKPEKDMETFRNMAKEGYHLCGLSGALSYKFEKGEPKDYIFSYTAAKNPDDDYIAYFTDAGWEPVILLPELQIFRALPGTEPIYTDTESMVNFYKEQIQVFSKYSIGAITFLGICGFVLYNIPNRTLGLILFMIGWIPFVFTVMPLAGFWYHHRKYKKKLISK